MTHDAWLRPSPVSLVPADDLRRTDPRVVLACGVDLWSEQNILLGTAGNVSSGGLFVAAHAIVGRVPAVGERLRVRFTLPATQTPIEADAVVAWVRGVDPTGAKPAGLGLRFTRIEGGARVVIDGFVGLGEPWDVAP
jgi:uncharacterized protein (TIGR02266 family)